VGILVESEWWRKYQYSDAFLDYTCPRPCHLRKKPVSTQPTLNESLETLYGIIIALGYLERASVRDFVTAIECVVDLVLSVER